MFFSEELGRFTVGPGFQEFAGGGEKTGAFQATPVFLQLKQTLAILFFLTAKARFLDAEIVELALVDEEDFGVDQVAADLRIRLLGEAVFEFEATDGVDAGFEGRDAMETPGGVCNGLDELGFFAADRFVLGDEAGDKVRVATGVFVGQQDGATGEAGF